MGYHNIDRKDWVYTLLKKTIVDFTHNKLFYRNVYRINSENIPKNDHLIYTPNHQNALMDALALLCNINQQLVFVARSDIFKQSFYASILYFLKILPIYRIRDGYSAVKKNADIFSKTVDVIKAQFGLVILPEGNHEGQHRLRQLKKGFARIAFQTEEASNFSLNIKVIPVGLHYSDYQRARSDLYLSFGEPIHVSKYHDLYKKSPAIAINKITAELTERLKPLMIHIENMEYYDLFDALRKLYWRSVANDTILTPEKRLKAEQTVIDKLEQLVEFDPDKLLIIQELWQSLKRSADRFKLDIDQFYNTEKQVSTLVMLFNIISGLPLFIYGLTSNLLPAGIVKAIVHSKIHDPQFKSSIKYVLSLVIFPFYYLIVGIVVSIFIESKWFILFIMLTMLLSGLYAHSYFNHFRKFVRTLKYKLFKLANPSAFSTIKKTKITIDQIIKHLM